MRPKSPDNQEDEFFLKRVSNKLKQIKTLITCSGIIGCAALAIAMLAKDDTPTLPPYTPEIEVSASSEPGPDPETQQETKAQVQGVLNQPSASKGKEEAETSSTEIETKPDPEPEANPETEPSKDLEQYRQELLSQLKRGQSLLFTFENVETDHGLIGVKKLLEDLLTHIREKGFLSRGENVEKTLFTLSQNPNTWQEFLLILQHLKNIEDNESLEESLENNGSVVEIKARFVTFCHREFNDLLEYSQAAAGHAGPNQIDHNKNKLYDIIDKIDTLEGMSMISPTEDSAQYAELMRDKVRDISK